MSPKPKSKRLVMLLPLPLVSAMLQSCSSTPTFVAAPCPAIPPLPQEARQPTTGCSPNCSKLVGSEISASRLKLTSAALPDQPASVGLTR